MQGVLSKVGSPWCSDLGQLQNQTAALSQGGERRAAPSGTASLSMCCFCLALLELRVEAAQLLAAPWYVGCPARS